MIVTVIIILTALVALNFVLLFFSCNKTTKEAEVKISRIAVSHKSTVNNKKKATVATQLQTRPLAATGS